MQLIELKKMPVEQLIELGEECGIENASRAKRQDIIFGILKSKAKSGEDIEGEGVLEILQDGFGFLRSPDASYLAGPDDIYVSPSQIRRFGLRTGDTIKGKIRSPKDGERYFAILKIEEINYEEPDKTKNKPSFENLTPLFPDERMLFALSKIENQAESLLLPLKINICLNTPSNLKPNLKAAFFEAEFKLLHFHSYLLLPKTSKAFLIIKYIVSVPSTEFCRSGE